MIENLLTRRVPDNRRYRVTNVAWKPMNVFDCGEYLYLEIYAGRESR